MDDIQDQSFWQMILDIFDPAVQHYVLSVLNLAKCCTVYGLDITCHY